MTSLKEFSFGNRYFLPQTGDDDDEEEEEEEKAQAVADVRAAVVAPVLRLVPVSLAFSTAGRRGVGAAEEERGRR